MPRASCRCRWRRSSRRSTPCRRSGSRSSRRRRSSGSWTSSTRSASRTRRSSSGSGGCARTGRRAREPVVVHGDFRIGNLVVDESGLVGVLDWEFAHLDDPARDLAFSLVRAWRFGARRPPARRDRRRRAVPRALQRADRLRRAARGARLLGARRQRRLGDRLPHAGAAPSDRPGAERRARDPRPARRRGRVRDLPPPRDGRA